jgi:hypothetical protein
MEKSLIIRGEVRGDKNESAVFQRTGTHAGESDLL